MRNVRHEILLVTDINLYAYFHSKKGQYIGYEKNKYFFFKKRLHFSKKVLVFFAMLLCHLSDAEISLSISSELAVSDRIDMIEV